MIKKINKIQSDTKCHLATVKERGGIYFRGKYEKRIKENIDIFDFELNEEEMKQISSLDMGYSGSRAKHFDVEFVEMCLAKKIHD